MSKVESPDITFAIGSMRIGGAERATLNLINGLAKKGMKIELVLIDKVGPLLDEVSTEVVVIDLKKKKASNSIFKFRKYLDERKPKIVFAVQNHVQLMTLVAANLSGWKGKIILNEQSTFSKNLKGFKGKVQAILSRFLFTKVDKITVVSRGVSDDFIRRFPFLKEKVVVINNPIINDKLFSEKENVVNHPFINIGYQVIIAAGRLVKSKNFELLIRAFKKANDKNKWKLIILGDGIEKNNLLQLIEKLELSNDVSLPGFVAQPWTYFSKADLFVLSSDYEGLPGVLIEAMACGCKVVSTDCESGPAEILQNGKLGVLCEVRNLDSLASSIQAGIEMNVESSKLVNRAMDFHEDVIIEQYLQLFNSL